MQVVAAKPGGAHELDRAEGASSDDEEFDAVALLYFRARPPRGSARRAPQARRSRRRSRRRRGRRNEGAGGDRRDADWPEPPDGDPGRALGRQRGGGAGPRQGVAHAIGGAGGAPEIEARRRRHQPPGAGHQDRCHVVFATGCGRRDGPQRGGLGAGQEDGESQQVRVGHGLARPGLAASPAIRRARRPAGRTPRSARMAPRERRRRRRPRSQARPRRTALAGGGMHRDPCGRPRRRRPRSIPSAASSAATAASLPPPPPGAAPAPCGPSAARGRPGPPRRRSRGRAPPQPARPPRRASGAPGSGPCPRAAAPAAASASLSRLATNSAAPSLAPLSEGSSRGSSSPGSSTPARGFRRRRFRRLRPAASPPPPDAPRCSRPVRSCRSAPRAARAARAGTPACSGRSTIGARVPSTSVRMAARAGWARSG